MYVVLAIVTGGLVSVMIQANGELQSLAGALPALLAIHLSGLVTTGAYVGTTAAGSVVAHRLRASFRPLAALTRRGASPSPAAARRSSRNSPLWFLTAGILGIVAVFINNEVYRHGGVVLTLMGTLAGQTMAAQFLEKTRWFDRRLSPPLQRLLALLFILPGTVLIGLWSRAGIAWVLISWIPGGVLMIQQMMNARNTIRFGSKTMLLFNYASALTALGLLVATSPSLVSGAVAAVSAAPIPVICGGGFLGVMVVGFSSFLFARAPALQVVLGMYAGQIAVGIVLDTLSARPLTLVNVAGVTMVVIGLLIGEVHRLRQRHSARARGTGAP